MDNAKHSLPEASLSCSQTTATEPLALLSSLAFLPTGPWAQFSPDPQGREIRHGFYFKSVASGAILITPEL